MKLAGMIFAAGESSRMGRDKAVLDFRGSTFLNHLLSLFLPRVQPVIVVLGHNAASIEKTIQTHADLRVVVNHDYKLGMLSSFQTGIRALPREVKAALFTLVDLPAVRASTLDRLLREFKSAGKPLVIPRYDGRRGHPVIASREILEEMLALAPESSPKEVIRSHGAETLYVDVDDPGIIHDVDVPSDYDELKATW